MDGPKPSGLDLQRASYPKITATSLRSKSLSKPLRSKRSWTWSHPKKPSRRKWPELLWTSKRSLRRSNKRPESSKDLPRPIEPIAPQTRTVGRKPQMDGSKSSSHSSSEKPKRTSTPDRDFSQPESSEKFQKVTSTKSWPKLKWEGRRPLKESLRGLENTWPQDTKATN